MRTPLRVLRNSSFKRQLNVAVTASVVLFAIISSMLTSWQGSRQVRQTLLVQGEHIAENLAGQSKLALLTASPENVGEAVKSALAFPDVMRVEIRHAGGNPLLVKGRSTEELGDTPFPEHGARQPFLERETGEVWRFVAPVLSQASGSPFEVLEPREEVLGYVRVVQSKATLSRMVVQIFALNLLISLVFALFFLFVLSKLANRLTRPITALSEAMARAEHGESSVRAEVSGPQDIRDMAQAFNSMIVALQERERALRLSQASYREVVDSVKEVIFQTDAEGRMVLVNPAWRDVTGMEPHAALGMPLAGFIGDEDRDVCVGWQDKLAGGELNDCRFEARFTRLDGSVGWLEVALHARYDDEGCFAGTSGMLDDITERRLAAARLENLNIELENRVRLRTEQLEASNRELEAFSYSVSHDLRAPLRAIDGFSRLIEEDYGDKLDATALGYFGRVRAATQRMSQLIDDLLDLARISRANLTRQPTDLSAMAGDVLRDLADAEAGRKVETEIEPGLLVRADPVLLRVVLVNLLGNAWKYSGKRDTACIALGRIRTGDGDKAEWAYYVRDNGAGFDMQFADKLFRPFTRLHSATEFGGSGVGLATVQRIIHRHGGRIWAESVVGQGATFYFTLPDAAN